MKQPKTKIEIVEQIRKLMIHERSARKIESFAEAGKFAEKIAALRAKYEITQEIVIDTDSPMFRRKRVFWEDQLFVAVCFYFDCRPVTLRNSNLKLVVGEMEFRG